MSKATSKAKEKLDKKESLDFEKALEELKNISQKLEKDELSLDESIKLYQEGMTLAQHCHSKLEEAEQVVKEVMIDKGELKLESFEVEDDF